MASCLFHLPRSLAALVGVVAGVYLATVGPGVARRTFAELS